MKDIPLSDFLPTWWQSDTSEEDEVDVQRGALRDKLIGQFASMGLMAGQGGGLRPPPGSQLRKREE